MFLAWDALPPADGFPNPRTVIEIASKSMVKQAKSVFLGPQTVTLPWPRVGDAPRTGVAPNVEPLKPLGKTRDSALVLA